MANVRRLTIDPPLTEAEFAGFCAANPGLNTDRDPSAIIIVRRNRQGRDGYSGWLLSQRGTIGYAMRNPGERPETDVFDSDFPVVPQE